MAEHRAHDDGNRRVVDAARTVLIALMPLSWMPLSCLMTQALMAQTDEPVPRATKLLPPIIAECRPDGDAARCAAAIERLRTAPDAATALPALRAHTSTLPLAALVPFTRLYADLLPYGSAAEREASVALTDQIEARAEAFAQAGHGDQIPELASQIARVFALARVDANGPIAALQAQVDAAFEQQREAACQALARRGAEAAPAIDSLLHLMQLDLPPNGHTKLLGEYYPMRDQPRLAAARALAAICPADPRSAVAHALIVADGDGPAERREAATALGRLGADGRPGVEALVAATAAPDSAMRKEAITALGMIGDVGAAATRRLEQLSGSDDKQDAALARAALRQIARARRRDG